METNPLEKKPNNASSESTAHEVRSHYGSHRPPPRRGIDARPQLGSCRAMAVLGPYTPYLPATQTQLIPLGWTDRGVDSRKTTNEKRMLWKVKDNGVSSGSEPVGSTRSLAPSVLQLFFPLGISLSFTHAHIHRSFSLTHLNAVSLSPDPLAADRWRHAVRCVAVPGSEPTPGETSSAALMDLPFQPCSVRQQEPRPSPSPSFPRPLIS
ncbi:unnamed protein product [Leuciscus chuanchicus]